MNLTDKHCNDLFQKIRNRFDKISMIDEKGVPTLIARNGRIFNLLFQKDNADTMVTISLMEPNQLKIYFNREMTKGDPTLKEQWFEFLHELRRFSVPRQMGFDLIDIEKAGLSVQDVKAMIQDKQQQQSLAESRFGKLEGTKRSSIQRLENVRIKVRHKDVIKDDVHGARSRNISALFIENNQGERFRFPFLHLAGVRAMARHMEEGGSWNDRMGQHILETTNKISTIRKFVKEARRANMICEKSAELFERLREKQVECRRNLMLMNGSRGYKIYSSTLAETLVEPIESIQSYFENVDAKVANMFPVIERILGEKAIETAVDQSLAECINWINEAAGRNAIRLLEPRTTVPGKAVQVTNEILADMKIYQPNMNNINAKSKQQIESEIAANKMTMPLVKEVTYGDETEYQANTELDQDKLEYLVAYYGGANSGRIYMYVISGTAKTPAGQSLQRIGKAARATTSVISALKDPLGALGKKLQGY